MHFCCSVDNAWEAKLHNTDTQSWSIHSSFSKKRAAGTLQYERCWEESSWEDVTPQYRKPGVWVLSSATGREEKAKCCLKRIDRTCILRSNRMIYITWSILYGCIDCCIVPSLFQTAQVQVNPMFVHPRVTCDVGKYADAYTEMTGSSPFARKDGSGE